ncbi:MAG: PKD domain-containing protein [Bacteroidales bacterium]|nr:PKD domain-containing protein [Bacteroidales bacterium]
MKKTVLLFIAIVSCISLLAQNPNDLVISGYVTNSNGLAMNNIQVCVHSDSMNPNPFSQCVYTNPNGWYTITVTNGSLTGSNQIYMVYMVDCNNQMVIDTVQNMQGALNAVTVDFVYCQQALCDAGFTYQVNGLNVNLTSSSTNSSSQHYWNFGGGLTSTVANPTVIYPTAGTYDVCHHIWDNNCSDTVCQTIVVGNTTNCTANFTYQLSGLTISLTPAMANTLATYNWSFGDGSTSTQYNATHTYTAAGTYTVCLFVSNGSCTDSTCQTIVVGNTTNCNVSFTYSGVNTPPNQIQFTGSVYPGISLTQWHWNFGDGTSVSGQQNPLHQYAQPGIYSVCASIVQSGVVLCSYCDSVIVGNTINCQASFTHNQNPNGTYTFTGSFNPSSAATQWTWSFGDSTVGTGQTITHLFPNPGYYNVCLTVTSTSCPAVTTCQTIYVQGTTSNCNANFTYQQSGAIVHFYNNNSGISPSLTMHYFWDFGDNTSSSQVNPTHTYTSPGSYNVCLTVSDSLNNCYNQYCQIITIGNNTTCQASFTFTYGSVYNAAFFGSFSPMSNSVQWHWDFGDSTTSNLQNPIHNFPGPGTYNVCLTVVTSTATCPTTTYCQTITIQGNPSSCNAYFNYLMNNATVYFHNVYPSTSTSMNYLWNFGDSTTSNLPNPVHTYLTYGTYNVCLFVWDSLSGCQDQFCQTIVIGNNGGFSGNVFASGVPADMGIVYLLSVVPVPNSMTSNIVAVASTLIDSGGYYLFQNIPYGNYLVQAHLDPSSTFFFSHLPTYYGDVLYWSQATYVNVGQVGLTIQYNINLISTVALSNGNGQISGSIVPGAGSKSITDIENVQVVLLDEFDTPLIYTYSDANGDFSFDNLPYGTYKIYAEVWGKDPVSATVILDNSNSTVNNVIITINEETVIASIKDLQNIYLEHISELYPNPARDNVYLDFDMKQNAKIKMVIHNIYGQEIKSEEINANTGANRLTFNVNNWSDGLYFVSLTFNDQYPTTKILNKLK